MAVRPPAGPAGQPGAIIHATGGRVEDYRAAVLATVACRKLVLVETGTTHMKAWHELFARAGVPTLNIIPRDGGVHPVPVPKGSLH